MEQKSKEEEYLVCERIWAFAILMTVAGYLGAFTYSIRGGVFCNAQTANFVMFAMALGNMNLKRAVYYLLPMSAYLTGTIISEIIPLKVRKYCVLRWETILVGFEVVVTIILGFLPESAPYQVSQIAINFICSMQYNTFKQAEKIPMATTFCTNHLRQAGVHLVRWKMDKDNMDSRKRALTHLLMIFVFIVGAIISTIICNILLGKAIWVASIILFVLFLNFVYSDLSCREYSCERK